jgi:hypothetical protein
MSRRRSRKRNVSVVIFGLTCPKRILNIKTVMKRLHKYKNIGYAPDLTTGLEELEHAVQMDLADLEKSFQQNS